MAIIELPRIGKAATSVAIRKIAIEEHVMGTLFATSETYAQHSSQVNGVGGEFIELAAFQDYLSENVWVTTSGNLSDQALVTALLTVGSDRILFASDYPFDMSTDAARWIEHAPISENDRRKICFRNAEALFGIAPQREKSA